MLLETERGKFRRGEGPGKPIGGNIAEELFARSLYALVCSRGLESQTALAKALGMKSNVPVGRWFRGERVPMPEYFGALLRLFAPMSETELDSVAGPWGKLLEEGRGRRGALPRSPVAIRNGERANGTVTSRRREHNIFLTDKGAARLLGVSEQQASQLRKGSDLPILMTKKQWQELGKAVNQTE